MKLIVRPEAEADLESNYRWYEERRSGLGDEFLAAVKRQIQQVLERPEAYPRVHPRLRRSLTTRFPFALFYLVGDDAVVLVAVLHQSRDPEHWQRRL